MGILSGYKRFKKYLRTGEGYKLCSEWTNADSVEMSDGTTLQESMDTVVNGVESTQNNITEVRNELKTSLGGMTFGVDAAGRYGYIKAGADTVTPFKKNAEVTHFNPTWVVTGASTNSPYASSSVSGSTVHISNGMEGKDAAFTLYVRSSEKYDFDKCIGIVFATNVSTNGSTYAHTIPVSFGGNTVNAKAIASQTGGLKHSAFYLDETARPNAGDGYIYAAIPSAVHTTGYPNSSASISIGDFYIIH